MVRNAALECGRGCTGGIRGQSERVQGCVRVAPLAASHGAPLPLAFVVTPKICVKLPEPQLKEQLPLFHWPVQLTGGAAQAMEEKAGRMAYRSGTRDSAAAPGDTK